MSKLPPEIEDFIETEMSRWIISIDPVMQECSRDSLEHGMRLMAAHLLSVPENVEKEINGECIFKLQKEISEKEKRIEQLESTIRARESEHLAMIDNSDENKWIFWRKRSGEMTDAWREQRDLAESITAQLKIALDVMNESIRISELNKMTIIVNLLTDALSEIQKLRDKKEGEK